MPSDPPSGDGNAAAALPVERLVQLVTIAELYYLSGLTQQQITDRTGVSRSTVSRMLTAARDLGIVKIQIEMPLTLDATRAERIADLFPTLSEVSVTRCARRSSMLDDLGRAAAKLLGSLVGDGTVIGVTWGRSLAAVARALPPTPRRDIKVVQIAGAVAANSGAPREIVEQLASKLNGDGILLNAPLLVDSPEVATALIEDPSNRDAIALAAGASVALIGIGVADETTSSLLSGGHLKRRDLRLLVDGGAVGDAGGQPIDEDGGLAGGDFAARIVGLDRSQIQAIPYRVVVAGGAAKAVATRAAIRGGFVTHLVTDDALADKLIALGA